ncbi:MAG TPA: MBL fold metallo-hydrolase [Steroidobacteraceae bacterium]|nr:MBL fold metallo-hydrolase [Steroidobacteraceae bacterium]
MMPGRTLAALGCLLVLTGTATASAQRAGSSIADPGARLPAPTAFPPSGTFPTTESVTLLDSDPRATIHYTLDGSMPTAASPVFDPWKLIFIAGRYDGNRGLKTHYTVRAMAIDGQRASAVSRFEYLIERRDRTAYVSQEVLPGVRMIRDSDNDKMFLLSGARKSALIDSGMGKGDLAAYVAGFTGGRPLIVIFTHDHGDHIGQADEFIRGGIEYIGAGDRAGLVRFLRSRGVPASLIARHVVPVRDGERIDLGDRDLTLYAVPGHTPGSMVIFDPKTAALFSGDAFGSNSPTIPDAAWMQFDPNPLDQYLAEVERVRSRLGGRMKYIMTGHNDRPLVGGTYLDNLEHAVHLLLDRGNAALVPSYRPTGLYQVIVGDRLRDPNWVAVNVNRDRYLPAPEKRTAARTD